MLALMIAAAATCALGADAASGSVSFKTYSSTIAYGWLVRGPDEMDARKSVLRIYLSSVDIGAKIKACTTLMCADGALEDGAMVDFSDAEHLGYAIRLNHELVQYSGGTTVQAFTLSADKTDHLAGRLHVDDSSFGGGKIDATFDLMLMKAFTALH
jgi:opacity protein-like surface antigen